MEEIRLGVRELIEFVMRSGDIDAAYRSRRRMQEGIRVHQQIQAGYCPAYKKEVPFENKTELEGIVFHVHGRCDGLYESEEEVRIDEIKSTSLPLAKLQEDDHPLHWAQVQCYGYFYCLDHDREAIDLQLTYVNSEEEDPVKRFHRHCKRSELAAFYLDLLARYLRFSKAMIRWKKTRQASLQQLAFPYPSYRKGQRTMAVGVYQAIEEGKRLFVEAPTGIGKTMSTLLPAVSALGQFDLDKIFYLTARNTGQGEAAKALALFRQEGVKLKSVQLTAKERICLNDQVLCTPASCPYAKGHFDRVNEALYASITSQDRFDRETIRALADQYQVCPHEFQLDLESFADVIIGDYNYFFDPRAYLRREFDKDETSAVLLVDEAHNLVDRSRAMYSAELTDQDLVDLEAIFSQRKKLPQKKQVVKACRGVMTAMDGLRERASRQGQEAFALEEPPEDLVEASRGLTRALDLYMDKNADDKDYKRVQTIFFALVQYQQISELWREGFTQLISWGEGAWNYKIQCLDPSPLLADLLAKVRSAIFFSATLSPLAFYQQMLGGSQGALSLTLDSPFPEDHLQLYQLSLSTRYRDRAMTLETLCAAIHRFADPADAQAEVVPGGEVFAGGAPMGREPAGDAQDLAVPIEAATAESGLVGGAPADRGLAGNVMVFFPSYAYLEQAADCYEARYGAIYRQRGEMGQEERAQVLEAYRTQQGQLGFFVLGGLFSEAIDLPGQALEGACIVSVGLPGLSFEREVLQAYFDRTGRPGYDYAYTYPGMNKVLQAAGRVIRSAEDRGRVLLIDDRFAWGKYRRLMPRHWRGLQCLRGLEDLPAVGNDQPLENGTEAAEAQLPTEEAGSAGGRPPAVGTDQRKPPIGHNPVRKAQERAEEEEETGKGHE